MRTVCLILAVCGLGACSGPTEIQLSADRTTISAGGIDHAVITAKVTLMGDPVAQGTTVTFATTGGSFSASAALTSDDKSADASGVAKIKLYSAKDQGDATVSVSFYDATTGLDASSSITITFGAASGAMMPVAGKFRMTCDAVNIGALRTPVPDIKVTCTLTATSRKGTTIPATALKPTFLSEAGSMTAKDDAYTGKRIYIHSPKGGASAPKDVDPAQNLGEPNYFDKNGKKRNPRDGLVTLVAVVDGEESFTDNNGNGKWDAGEPFVDVAEPFVDKDDDDKWSSDETYLDANGNGKWDKANAKWDAKTKVMAIYKILWTGALDNADKTSRLVTNTGQTSISDGGKLEIIAYALDVNMNPVAAFGANSDQLEWTLNQGNSYAQRQGSDSPAMKNLYGFSFDTTSTTERKRWLIVSNSFAPPKYSTTVVDGYPGDTDAAATYSMSAKVFVTAGPKESGYFTAQVTEAITKKVEGTCD